MSRLNRLASGLLCVVMMTLVGCGSSTGNGGGSEESDPCEAPVEISEDVTSDRTIGDEASCYLVTTDWRVVSGATLTIQPGTILQFQEDYGLTVDGQLLAEGQSDDEIVFTGAEETPGLWKGIFIYGGDELTRMEHTIVEYGGAGETTGNLTTIVEMVLEDSTLRHSSGFGLVAVNGASFTSFSNNRVTNNGGSAARVKADVAGDFASSNEFTGNEQDRIVIDGGDVGWRRVTHDATWFDLGVPYAMTEANLEVRSGATLTLDPGTTVAFEQNRAMVVDGQLVAEGTSEEQILLTGIEKMPGAWNGLSIDGLDATSRLKYVTVEYGGGGDPSTNLEAGGFGEVVQMEVEDSIFRHSSGYGIVAVDPISFDTFANNRVTDNAKGAARLKANAVGDLAASNDMTGNERDRILVDAEKAAWRVVTNDATWSDLGVPYNVKNGDLEIQSDTVLTLESGVEMVLGEGVWIPVDGVLKAQGSEENRIVFRGEESNAGYWQAIRVTDGGSQLEYVDIRDAGDGSNTRGSLVFATPLGESAPSATFGNVSIQNGEGTCLFAKSETSLSPCTNLEVNGCGETANYGGTTMSLSNFKMNACQSQ